MSLTAATLLDGGSIGLGADTDISVSPGNEGFSAAGGGAATPFNGAVYDYAFFDTNSDPSAPTFTGPQGLIGNLSDTSGTDNKVNLWISGDPGVDPPTSGDVGVRWQDNATFTVDISGLTSGSIYVFNGSWQARTDWLELSMTGVGQTAVTMHSGAGNQSRFGFSPAEGNRLMNAKRIDFADAADYDTITFTLQESTEGQNGYFGGVVITNVAITSAAAVPEPSAMVFAGWGALMLLRRRR